MKDDRFIDGRYWPMCPHCGRDIELDAPISAGGLTLDPRAHRVTWNGTPVHLGPSEFILLHTLLKAEGRLVTREMLMARISTDRPRNVERYLSTIRGKMPGHRIELVIRVGWRWAL